MQRHRSNPRHNWQSIVEQQGLTFHTPEALTTGARPYWDESACYEFSATEIDTLEAAGNQLQEMCLAAAQNVIDNKRYAQLEIPAEAVPLIEWAWEKEPPALYGRFDIMWSGSGEPKLLEYNADTPTSLLEAAVIQWYWLTRRFRQMPTSSTHCTRSSSRSGRIVASYLAKPVYFASAPTTPKTSTHHRLHARYRRASRHLTTRQMLMEDIGWNEQRQCFVDTDRQPKIADPVPLQAVSMGNHAR